MVTASVPVITPAPTLLLVDRTILVGVPLIGATALMAFPAWTGRSLGLLGILTVAVWVISLLGTLGRAPWRRFVYPIIIVGIAGISLLSQGPTAGVGAAAGLAVLLAGAMSSRVGLWCVVAVGIVALVLGAISLYTGDALPPVRFDGLTVWIRVGLVIGVVTWIATQALDSLIQSLEVSYERAVDAYRKETETREQLDSSRQDLDEAEHVALVGRLAGGVAHDINNALTAILAASDLLGDKVVDGDQRRNLAELEAASRQAAELVRDLLWIGRQFPPTTSSAQVETTVAACLQRLDRIGRRIAIDVDLPPLRVALAPERLEQVLFRMILRAHRAGVTRLALRGARNGSMIEIDLRGSSRSVAPGNSLSRRPKAVSARLGMSAAKEVVEQAGGTLRITEDDDLSVYLCLPIAEADKPVELPTGNRARTALVVDDEPLILGRLSKLVARRGYTVLSASSLAEAWPLLATGPDLLVTDLQLGDGRGEELAIASFANAPERPIVVCSGFGADDAFRDQLRDARIQFLTKPFTMADLNETIPKVAA